MTKMSVVHCNWWIFELFLCDKVVLSNWCLSSHQGINQQRVPPV